MQGWHFLSNRYKARDLAHYIKKKLSQKQNYEK